MPLFIFHDTAEKEKNDALLRLEIATMDIYEATKIIKRRTAGITNLDTSLTDMHRDDFTHFGGD